MILTSPGSPCICIGIMFDTWQSLALYLLVVCPRFAPSSPVVSLEKEVLFYQCFARCYPLDRVTFIPVPGATPSKLGWTEHKPFLFLFLK